MAGPGSQVADLIMQLMMRGKSGGLPMQASPELTQYLAHAQGGTAPPQQRGIPSADVLPGPGSGAGEISSPDFLSVSGSKYQSEADLLAGLGSRYDESGQQPDVSPLDLMTESPGHLPTGTFRQEGYGDFQDQALFIWATDPRTGKRIKLDGPFTNDIEAARELKMLRQSGLDTQVEIAPDFDGPGNPLPPLNSF